MSNVVSAYPNSFFTWTDRVDQVNIDFANDINSVASDLIAVETALGTNPQIEPNPPGGIPASQISGSGIGQQVGGNPIPAPAIVYGSLSARVSDAINNAQMPVCSLAGIPAKINNTSIGQLNNYRVLYDPYKMFNGQDITIPTLGWYLITVHQAWSWWSDGYSHTYLTANGASNILDQALINWAFAGNVVDPNNPNQVPRWQRFGQRSIVSHIIFQGGLNQGDRISVYSENGTSNSAQQISNMTLKVSMIKRLSNVHFTD